MTDILIFFAAEGLIAFCYYLQKKMAGGPEKRMMTFYDVCFSVAFAFLYLGGSISDYLNQSRIGFSYDDSIYAIWMRPGALYAVFLLFLLFIHWIAKKRFFRPDKKAGFASFVYVPEKKSPNSETQLWAVRSDIAKYRPLAEKSAFWGLLLCMFYLGICALPAWYFTDLDFAVPLIGLLPVYTFSLYIGGKVQQETSDEVLGEGLKTEKKSNFRTAEEHLKRSFPDALIRSSQKKGISQLPAAGSILRKFESSGDFNKISAAAYFRSEAESGDVVADYVQLSADLNDKKNVLIRNPFYKDLGMYLSQPLSQSLMRKNKVLILTPESEKSETIKQWIQKVLDPQMGFKEKWNIKELEDLIPECQVGILHYSNLLDPNVLKKNRLFFEQTEYVILLKPSAVMTTMQIPLNVLSDLLKKGPVSPVFCILDLNLVHLKDTISHILKTQIDCDIAIADSSPDQTIMIWDTGSDFHSIERFDKQTRYLGGGIELGAEAVSVQIPEVTWISEENVPLYDLQDFAAQSVRSITKVMRTESSQHILREKLRVNPDPWSLEKKKSEFLIVEDEFNNPYAAASHFASRGKKEVFLNIMSENYLLRDYICSNAEIFETNPNAIPSLVPDFAKTRRNVLLKLILQMHATPMEEKEILRELDLVDIHTDDLLKTLNDLLLKYTYAETDLFEVETRKIPSRLSKPETVRLYSIRQEKFDQYFSRSLKKASYLLEDEVSEKNILDSKLYSLILQTVLPGQLLNFRGKSYEVRKISPYNGVVLHRASDLIDGRKYYQQIRHYRLPVLKDLTPTSFSSVNGFRFTEIDVDFSVITNGYIEMQKRGDLKDARVFDFTGDPAFKEYIRWYRNKSVLMIEFPEADQTVLYQLALILQEILPTVIPQGYPYLSLLVKRPESFDGKYAGVLYSAENLPENVLAVVEDSDIDLGLIAEFKNYFFTLLEIAQDYIRWNFDQIKEDVSAEEETENFETDTTVFDSLEKIEELEAKAESLKLIARIAWLIEDIGVRRMMEEDKTPPPVKNLRKMS